MLRSIQDLSGQVGLEIATSEWLTITQNRIDQFANATNDRQWIHVDVDRAERETPTGSTIAHGYLTLSLIAGFAEESFQIAGVRQVINCGLNRVRFLSPVPVNSRLRAKFVVGEFKTLDAATTQVIWHVTVELEGSTKPACIADAIFRYYIATGF